MSWYDIIKFASVTMKVYHGTGSMKSILDGGFSYEFSGRGNEQYGPGFYFTNNYETAKGYTTRRISPEVSKLGGEDSPGVITAEITFQNPIMVNAHACPNDMTAYPILTNNQAKQMLNEAIKQGGMAILENWGDIKFEGLNAIKNKAIDTYTGSSSIIALGDLFGSNNIKQGLRTLSKIIGYDGLVVQISENEYHVIAWFPEQIKIL